MSNFNIGLLGFSGRVGSALIGPLLEAHRDGKINLIILHRVTSDLSKIPFEVAVEKRVVELIEAGMEGLINAVEVLDVLISTISGPGFTSQKYLVDALASSKRLKTFIPSDFGVSWTEEESSNPVLPFIKLKTQVVHRALELGIPVTNVRLPLFDELVLGYGKLGMDVKKNKVEVYRNSLINPLRITTLPYLAYALTQLIQSPSLIANRTITLYDHSPTGKEIIDVLTKIHGYPTEVTEYTEERYEADLGEMRAAIGAAAWKRWGDGVWGEEEKVEVDGWHGESFEELVRKYI
ncbi:hypothetical protein I302_105169 [Kwoniella bestiolae CBS 10118]|uniref:NmrA-like domain-containing protein n=1 Tax=Kwoniella bestiolae CBS 10118 TaxID=1296100 RepID=A0A1B9FSE9_9TREE|nr:hypothetical protein I302_08457 [Kwoniella bestiolae CBS 10118]OCF21680.1 hypothetical protein I302_08457 [Kwoniella bestiolae CBS 10118]